MNDAKWYNSLRVQIMLLLSLALFPLGAVAMYQTSRVEAQATRSAELALLAMTGSAAKDEEFQIQRALGVARFFGSFAENYMADPLTCSQDLQRFIANNDTYSFIGVLPPSGQMTCTSTGENYDASQGATFADMMTTQDRRIGFNPSGVFSGKPIINIFEPFGLDGAFAGFIAISIPYQSLQQTPQQMTDLGLLDLFTISANGGIMSTRTDIDDARRELPDNIDDLDLGQEAVFAGTNQNNEPRIYAVVPISSSNATTIGVWQQDMGPANRVVASIAPAMFPALMWLASTAVAMMSVYMLVLRHLSWLQKGMDNFARNRSIGPLEQEVTMPNEIQALADNFSRMTDDILREEANLENTLREKSVLIKEVHHRVKNNLQLISSIMNMHIRTATQAETREVLSRLQDRVLSLATIHRDLYQSPHGGMVDVGTLVAEIVQNSIDVGLPTDAKIDVQSDIDLVLLYPDQAVPLSLLVAEAMTNAMKYLGAATDTRPSIHASLHQVDEVCTLMLCNSTGDTQTHDRLGLGAKLIEAFRIQLGGTLNVDHTDDAYTLTLTFTIDDFKPDARDF